MAESAVTTTRSTSNVHLDDVQTALRAFASGKLILVVDDADRENEGDLIVAGEDVTVEQMAFIVRHTSGIVCVPMSAARCQQLELPAMVADNTDPHRTAFTVSVDLLDESMATGVSAADRVRTVHALADCRNVVDGKRFARPGHVFPLRACEAGLRERRGHTEAAVELCRLTGKHQVAVISEVVDLDECDGRMARGPYLERFAREHGLPMISVEALARHVVETQGDDEQQ